MRAQHLIGTDMRSPLSADVQVERSTTGYRARMRIETSAWTGARVLEEADCDRLADAVVLVYALGAGPVQDEPARWSLAAYGGGVLGPLPALAPGAAAALALEWRALRLALSGSYHVPQLEHFADSALAGRFQLWSAGARAGLSASTGRVELSPALGVRLHHFTSAGEGGIWSRRVRVVSWGPALSLLVRLRLTEHWAVALDAEAAWQVPRWGFVLLDTGRLHRSSAVTLAVWLGCEVRL